MPTHRILVLRRNSIECTCGDWSLRLDKSCTFHSATRANHLMDSFLRHAAEEAAKVCKGVGERAE